jgi:hypothetical protein
VRGIGFVRVRESGEKGRKKQGNKPLLPLLLRVQRKKENNVIQNDTVSKFFF